jgi:hypothetical protein
MASDSSRRGTSAFPPGSVRVGRTVAGVGFLVAALFNATVTRRNATRVFATMQRDAWLPPWRWLIRRVVAPRGPAIAVAAAGFEAVAGVCMLGHGRVARGGLIAGAGWAVITTPVLPPAQAVPNLAIAPVLLALAACVDDARS